MCLWTTYDFLVTTSTLRYNAPNYPTMFIIRPRICTKLYCGSVSFFGARVLLLRPRRRLGIFSDDLWRGVEPELFA